MNTKKSIWVVAALIAVIASLFSFNYAAAAAPDGMSPATGWAPSGAAHSIDVGQTQWFAFQYGGGNSQILVQLWGSGVQFGVWTADRITAWMQGGTVDPVGRGSADSDVPGDLSWSGNFNLAGTYYIRVDSTGMGMTSYMLKASGDSVWFATPAAAAATGTSTPPAAPQTAAAPVVTAPATGGTGMSDALTANGKWAMLNAGQSRWYKFEYVGDKSQLRIDLNLPTTDVTTAFSVITPAEATAYASSGTLDVIGRGSPDKFDGSGLFWSGNFDTAGTYYVKVDAGATAPSYYSLTITP